MKEIKFVGTFKICTFQLRDRGGARSGCLGLPVRLHLHALRSAWRLRSRHSTVWSQVSFLLKIPGLNFF